MPSDAHAESILRPLAAPVQVFRSALALAAEQVRGFLALQRSRGGANEPVEKALLGPFVSGRIDIGRFEALLSRTQTLDPVSLDRIEKAYGVLCEIEARTDALLETHVEPGGDLRAAVGKALASVGRAYGAARVFELVRTGHFREADHGAFLEAFPFDRWTRAERGIAPPLLLHVNGRDVRAETLAEYLDGAVKIVLDVHGDAPLAPLVRLITPGTLVLQTRDGSGLDRLAAWSGPAIAAWLPEGSALFLHDPAAGVHPWERLSIQHLPEAGTQPKGGRSVRQQAEELRQLASLAAGPSPGPSTSPARAGVPVATAASADPVDRLASWLMAHADLKE